MKAGSIIYSAAPTRERVDALSQKLLEFNAPYLGEPDVFAFFLYHDDGEMMAGLKAFARTDTVMIDLLWVCESLRGQGVGTTLLQYAEREARNRNHRFILVTTADFQAPLFYEKQGFTRIAEVPGFTNGHALIYLRKSL